MRDKDELYEAAVISNNEKLAVEVVTSLLKNKHNPKLGLSIDDLVYNIQHDKWELWTKFILDEAKNGSPYALKFLTEQALEWVVEQDYPLPEPEDDY